jgi:hypothetical protein
MRESAAGVNYLVMLRDQLKHPRRASGAEELKCLYRLSPAIL